MRGDETFLRNVILACILLPTKRPDGTRKRHPSLNDINRPHCCQDLILLAMSLKPTGKFRTLFDGVAKRSGRNVLSVAFMKEHNVFRRSVLCEVAKRSYGT